MANRCPDCNKFVSLEYEVDECEGEVDVDSKNHPTGLTIHVHVNGNCAECGTAITEATFDIDHEGISLADFEEC